MADRIGPDTGTVYRTVPHALASPSNSNSHSNAPPARARCCSLLLSRTRCSCPTAPAFDHWRCTASDAGATGMRTNHRIIDKSARCRCLLLSRFWVRKKGLGPKKISRTITILLNFQAHFFFSFLFSSVQRRALLQATRDETLPALCGVSALKEGKEDGEGWALIPTGAPQAACRGLLPRRNVAGACLDGGSATLRGTTRTCTLDHRALGMTWRMPPGSRDNPCGRPGWLFCA